MQVNSKITLEAPQESQGVFSRPSAAQGENNFSAVLEAKTTESKRQADSSSPAHSSKATSASAPRTKVKPQDPAVADAARAPRSDTKPKSPAAIDHTASPSRTEAKSQDKAAGSSGRTASVAQDAASEATSAERDSELSSEHGLELTNAMDKQDKIAVKKAATDGSAWADVNAAAEESSVVMESSLLTPDFLAPVADDPKVAPEPLPQEAKSKSDASMASDAAAIDFLQHLQTSLATNTQVVIPKANPVEQDLSSLLGIDPAVTTDLLTAESGTSGKFLPPLGLTGEARVSSPDSPSPTVTAEDEGFSQWLDELALPAEPVPNPSEQPALSSNAVTTAEGAAKPGTQEVASVMAASVKGAQGEAGTNAGTDVGANARTVNMEPEPSERTSELAQLAALLAGSGKREGASRATEMVSEAAAPTLVRSSLEATKAPVITDPVTDAAVSLNSILSPQTSRAAGDEFTRDGGSLQVNIQPETVRSTSAGATSELNALLGTQGAATQAAATSAAAAQETLSRGRETPVSLAAIHLGLPQQAAPELAARMTLMMGQKWHEAEIQLEPQGLGKMSIQLSIDQDQKANVQFIVQHGSSRELLEQALPKLRDMLASQGIQLGQTNVQQQSAGQQQDQGQLAQQSQGQGNGSSSPWRRGENSQGESVDVQNLVIRSTDASGIDFYA
jgi:flagellar hook-length control protein FliK